MITKSTQKAFFAHAVAEYPREACGLAVVINRRQQYVPCRNIATDPGQDFVMAPEDYADAEDRGRIVAVLHSHPDAPADPSFVDMNVQRVTALPWGIASVREGLVADFKLVKPVEGPLPILGRPFVYGVLDCFTIIRDVYAMTRERLREELDVVEWPFDSPIELPDFDREGEHWEDGRSLYLEHMRDAGFKPIDTAEIRPGDVFVMQIGRNRDGTPVTVPNHGAVYIGGNRFVHHLDGHLSRREVYGGMWAEKTVQIARYMP